MTTAPIDLYSAKVLADSDWDLFGRRKFRITTFELVFPRCVLAEFNTHCQLARNSASSRAIPVEKMLQRVMETPFIPLQFSKNQKGMSASEYWVPGDPHYDVCVELWLAARDKVVDQVCELINQGVHKQDANRLLEPWMWHTVVATATWEHWDWPNFIRLRADQATADPKIYPLAVALRDAAEQSVPVTFMTTDQWHLPLIGFEGDEDLSLIEKIKVSIARVARTSYLTHDGQRDVAADLDLYERIKGNGHLSPFEQVARPKSGRNGKYTGWVSARSWVENGQEIEV